MLYKLTQVYDLIVSKKRSKPKQSLKDALETALRLPRAVNTDRFCGPLVARPNEVLLGSQSLKKSMRCYPSNIYSEV